ncbi:hypothetical protein B0H15DRAFT_792471, partial [Mycena belliarum]
MVKTTNSLVGKRELTGQQTASLLLGRKNNYTSNEYREYWWSSMLRDLAQKRFSNLFNDVFYRPTELDSMCAWDILRNYVKEKKPKSKTQRKTYLNFKRGHPQYTTHCLKKLDTPVIPVLMGYRIPRNDSENDRTKYAVIILTLFKVWSDTKASPLKSADCDWLDALDEFKLSMCSEHARILLNMQLMYQTRDAKFDYA